MNKDIQEKAQALNQWILNQEVVIEFKKYEKIIHNNPELKKQEEVLKQLQQTIVQQKHQGNDCEELIKDYKEKERV